MNLFSLLFVGPFLLDLKKKTEKRIINDNYNEKRMKRRQKRCVLKWHFIARTEDSNDTGQIHERVPCLFLLSPLASDCHSKSTQTQTQTHVNTHQHPFKHILIIITVLSGDDRRFLNTTSQPHMCSCSTKRIFKSCTSLEKDTKKKECSVQLNKGSMELCHSECEMKVWLCVYVFHECEYLKCLFHERVSTHTLG